MKQNKPVLLRLVLLLALLLGSVAQAQPGRVVPVERRFNARNLDGIPLAEGQVRPAMLYRSAQLCSLSQADLSTLRGLGLRTIVDLRSSPELEREGLDSPELTGAVSHYVTLRVANGERGVPGYLFHVQRQKEDVAHFFHLLAQEQSYPLLFHCRAGKDRTGIMTALLLELLGATRETIAEDYLLSSQAGSGAAFEVDRGWIEAVFQAIDEEGGIEEYLDSCGVSAAEQKAIRNLLILSG